MYILVFSKQCQCVAREEAGVTTLAREYKTPNGRRAVVDVYESLWLRDEFVREFMSRKSALVDMIETFPMFQTVLLDTLTKTHRLTKLDRRPHTRSPGCPTNKTIMAA